MMFRNVFVFLCVAIVCITPLVTRAQSVSNTLIRMDQLIIEMEKLRAEFAALSATAIADPAPVPTVLGANTTKTLTMDLSYGATNKDIALIQRLLATDATIYPYGVDSGFFGPKTQEAIRNFQARFGLDTVGVVGPATQALLEVFFNAYPDEQYPEGVLTKKPQVQGVNTTVPPASPTPVSVIATDTDVPKKINVQLDSGEALIELIYTNGTRKGLVAPTDDEAKVVTYISGKTGWTTASIEDVIDFMGKSSRSSSQRTSESVDEDDADDALQDAEDAISDAEDAIEKADDDREEVDWSNNLLDEADDALRDAEDAYDDGDYLEAFDLANEAEDLANEAEDRIGEEKGSRKGDSDQIDSIFVEIDDGESDVTVEYDNGDEYIFTIEEDYRDSLIEEIADELHISERDVEKLVEFDYGDVDYISAVIESSRTLVHVYYESGVRYRIILEDEDNENTIITDVADEIEESERDVKNWIKFDHN